MTNFFYEKLLDAIIRDDVKSYSQCEAETFCGSFSFARFPVLSAMYLLRAKKLIRIYEEKYIKINSFTDISESGEPTVLSDSFRKIAGKCLRLYIEEIVTPCEMLLLLGEDKRLKKLYPFARPSSAVKSRLEEIYSIRYALSLKCAREEIVMDKRPMTKKERKKLLTAVISAVLSVAIVVATPFVVNVFYPFINVPDAPEEPNNPSDPDNPDTPSDPDNPSKPAGKYYLVSDATEIDFASNNVYTLAADVTMTAETVSKMQCTLKGDGKKITVSGAKPMFDTISETGTVENVTIDVVLSGEITSDYAVIAKYNYGTIKNVTVNISGNLSVNGTKETETSDGVRLAGIAVNNGSENNRVGTVENCTVTTDLILKGTVESDASFSGIVANNYYLLKNSSLSGKIESETVDLAGICDTNNYLVSDCVNNAELKQTSPEQTWSPFVAGINAHNYYVVQNCVNNGALTSISTCKITGDAYPTASVGGIAIDNAVGTYSNGQSVLIYECANNGALKAQTEHANIRIGGIVARCYGNLQLAVNYGDITASSSRPSSENAVGGIAGTSCGYVVGAYSKSTITLNGTFKVGGITGYAKNEISNYVVYTGLIKQCISESTINLTSSSSTKSFVGGIVGYLNETLVYEGTEKESYASSSVSLNFDSGTLTVNSEHAYIGSTAGGCDEHIASENNFNDNYSINETLKGIGAVKSGDGYGEGEKIGSIAASLEEIEQNDKYLEVINALKDLLKSEEQTENS